MNETGSPAVTLRADGVILALPEFTLDKAHAAGVSKQDAVRLLIERFNQHCSDIIDLNEPRSNLKVRLFLSRPVAFEDAAERVRDAVIRGLEAAKQTKLRRIRSLFVVDDEHTEFVIDNVPTWRAHAFGQKEPCLSISDPVRRSKRRLSAEVW